MKKQDTQKSAEKRDVAGNALLSTLGVFLGALLLLYWSAQWVPRRHAMMFTETLRDYASLSLMLSTVNLVLLLYLLYIYWKDFLLLGSKFTGGLLLFLGAMLLYSLTASPWVASWFGPGGMGASIGVSLITLMPQAFTTLALVVLTIISND